MGLLDRRILYKNEEKEFEYETAFNYFELQNQVHWLWSEVPMRKDQADWELKLTDNEKNVVGNILKGFAQAEVMVNDYWRNNVGLWFPKPEVGMMAGAFSNMEGIHTKGYAFLNECLDLEDYVAFLADPSSKAKIDRLDRTDFDTTIDVVKNGSNCSLETKMKIATSLAIFSAFTEGVQLFSSFAVLLSFRTTGRLSKTANIIEWSVRDESMHSDAGCWLFRTFLEEYPEVNTAELKENIIQAAELTVKLEDDFIDKIFEGGAIKTLDPYDLKQFIRQRTNVKLGDLGYNTKMFEVDEASITNMQWFGNMTAGAQSTDFFDGVVTNYSKGNIDWGKAMDFNMSEFKDNFGGKI